MNRVKVVSSNIKSVGWVNETLEVEFNSGSVYQYKGVPKTIYDNMMASESKGKFFNSIVKDKYAATRVPIVKIEEGSVGGQG